MFKIRQMGRARTTTITTVVITTIINVLFEISKLLLSMKIVKFFIIISMFKISTLEAQRSQTRIMFMLALNLVIFFEMAK